MEELAERDAGDEGVAFGYAEYGLFESELLFDIDYSAFKVHSRSLEEATAELLSSLLSMREEGSPEFHLSCPDDGEIISEKLHLGGKYFPSFREILVEAPSIFDLGNQIVEYISGMSSAFLIKLSPQLVQLEVAFGVELVPRKVDASIS